MTIAIIRNGQQYGPYDVLTLLTYVNSGQVLLRDKAIADGEVEPRTVAYYLRRARLKPHIANKGNIVSQIRAIGSELIFPRTTLFSKKFLSDQRFMILALVGLFPMLIMQLPIGGFLVFYVVSLYFSVVWGMFFYECFKTQQVKMKTTLSVFFLTQAFVFLVWNVFGIYKLNPFYALTESVFPLNIIGFTLGVGLTEELAKAAPLLIILSRAKEPMIPQTMD